MKDNLNPAWLDEEFIKQILKSVEGLKDEQLLTVSKWQCDHAVPPGNNYLSLLHRLQVNYKKDNDPRSISLIVKTPLESGTIKEFVEEIDGYGKELRMYTEALPKMYEIAKNSITVTACSYACPLQNSVVLEDLREQGYKMSDRLKQLDADHCRQFLISLAKFHGLTVALGKKEPQLFESLGKSWFHGKKEEVFLKFNLTAMSKTVNSMGLERYADIIQNKIDSFYETIQNISKSSGGLIVLNHGDCWTNNFLFKYDNSNNVMDAKLIDFQTLESGSYAQDVIMFWWTSAQKEVRENLQEEMFEVYRTTLNQTLEDIEVSERVSKEEFDNEIKRFSPYALEVCSSILTVAMADPDDLADFNDMSENEFEKPLTADSPATKNFRSKYYRRILPDLLRQLETFGAFS